MSSSNARRTESESDRNRRRAQQQKSVRRTDDVQRNDLLLSAPPPASLGSVPKHFSSMQQLPPPPAPLSAHQPQPLMAERRPPPGMAITFSGQAYTDSELLNEMPRKQFTGRCRLFVGNLSVDVKETELKELFTPHGDISECYLSGKGFAFLRLDTRAHAESAKEALDGKTIHGRQLRVRYAVHGATIKVKELSPAVSNEMLFLSFSAFGDVERAIHIVDEKGRPTGEGIVEFERKVSAQEAIAQIRERVFLMTANSRPLYAEFVDPKDEEDGLSEKMIQRSAYLYKERELGPRFAQMNSFEYVYGRRWKELYEFERKRRAEVEAELREQRRRLDADMEAEYEDYKAQMLREELQHRQEELDRLEVQRQMRRQQMQQQQLLGAGMMWEPQMVDGPLGRNMPPTFGPAGGGLGGGGGANGPLPRGPLMMMDNNNNAGGMPPSLLRQNMPQGGLHGAGGAPPSLVSGLGLPAPSSRHHQQHQHGAGDEKEQRHNASPAAAGRSGSGTAGAGGLQNGRAPSPQGPDVRKLLQQGFRLPQQGARLQGPLPPGLASLLDRVPLQQQQQQQQQQQLLPNPYGAGFLPQQGSANGVALGSGPPPPAGGRIPPPPPPMGGGGAMLQHHMLQSQSPGGGGVDYPPGFKKARH